MSHNVRLSGVKFTDLVSLGQIISEVSKGHASLDTEGKTFRTFYGESNKCDAVIRLPAAAQYDIGLTRNAEGHYEPLLESYLVNRGTVLGPSGAPLGLVQQEYALREAEYEAAQRGMATERLEGTGGKITLRITVND